MQHYYHSVRLDMDKCKGCTTCLKRCPTEAIRIRNNRASILNERCIDCGECIKVCANHAKVAVTDPLESIKVIKRYKYPIALPAPTLYAQFQGVHQPEPIIASLFRLGFVDVFEVARAAEIVSYAISRAMREEDRPKPVLSSACPAILRLIQVSFPALLDNVIDFVSPMEAAAKIAKEEYAQKHGVDKADVGVFFITPCAAKMTAIRNPLGHKTSAVNGAISFLEVYGVLSELLRKGNIKPDLAHFSATSFGVNWARTGGEALAIGENEALAVDGIDNVIRVLEEIENNRLPEVRYFEGLACLGGCVGGPLTFENMFIARNRIRLLAQMLPKTRPEQKIPDKELDDLRDAIYFEEPLKPFENTRLDEDFKVAMEKMARIRQLRKQLPGLDCGSCGSPTCQALAEDVVQGFATELNCIHLLKERLSFMASQMVEMAEATRE